MPGLSVLNIDPVNAAESWRQRTLNIDEVTRYAKINRVAKGIQPNLEAVVA